MTMRTDATVLLELRAKASALRAQVKELNEEIDKREAALLIQLKAFPLPEAYVTVPEGTIRAVWKSKPEVDDPLALREHIKATDAWDLLQQRLSEAGIRERWEAGDSVPGIKRNDFLALSFSAGKTGGGSSPTE